MDTLTKLRPDRDLQCYFFQPSAAAALSATSPTGFTLSGAWRQQFDWAVIEWNRDNVFEHPAFRPLPDGDLSGLTLSYEETRTNCIPIDSDLYPTVDWPNLRIWAGDSGQEQVYRVPLKTYATPVEGQYQPGQAQFTLSGAVTAGDSVGLAFPEEHYYYQFNDGDTLVTGLQHLVSDINAISGTYSATLSGSTVTVIYWSAHQASPTGANGNRVGVYSYVSGAGTEQWDCAARQFTGGTSPTRWRIVLPFGSSSDPIFKSIPMNRVRKMRWTYSAELQPGAFQRSEFQVVVSNWTVTGTKQSYQVAGPGSRRFEDTSTDVHYTGSWTRGLGNFSGGFIHSTNTPGSSVSCAYTATESHNLYLGTRLYDAGAKITYSVDGNAPQQFPLMLPGEDVLVRTPLAALGPGEHTVTVTHCDLSSAFFYFDFFEVAVPSSTLPAIPAENCLALATDWDTNHSIALAPERTAWLINSTGFRGRVNHYAGALWFYELVCDGQQYASATVTFSGTPDPNLITTITINRTTALPSDQTVISHLNLPGDTCSTIATAFALLINSGYNAIRAEAEGSQLLVFAREMGESGNEITIETSAPTQNLQISLSSSTLAGGQTGTWHTDLNATPRINRAARDWHASYYNALRGYSLDVTTSFSMELQNGDPNPRAGIAQQYPNGDPVLLDTPALQTNFSPTSAAFWQQVYCDMALIQAGAGLTPYLQFGEVQWWYFANASGMPFYDAYTTTTFKQRYGRDMQVITSNDLDPASVPEEASFLPTLIGAFTNQISAFVLKNLPQCRFEVLYPVDVNSGRLNAVINYPTNEWTPEKLACLKTESFTFTYSRNLDVCKKSIDTAAERGFTRSHGSHLVGIADAGSPWLKEARIAESRGLESVVLFALDQLCLIGYHLPLPKGPRRSIRMA
jgi:hypothetical protein